MEISKILSFVDHTALSVTTTSDDIRVLCDDAIKYKTASVCIPPHFVKFAKNYVAGAMPICTVIGFPNGYSTTKTKVFETRDAIENGADEIDMVINICLLKENKYDELLCEIKEVKKACGDKILKVIIETAVLTDEEKIKMCEIVSESGADFIKTSTGFSSGGATIEDVDLFRENVYNNVIIKAAGGIKSFDDAKSYLEHGANRLGTSSLIKILKQGAWGNDNSDY